MLFKFFDMCEKESAVLIEKGLVLPAYDYCLKCSHLFNMLNARGVISVSERQRYMGRVRNLAKMVASAYVEQIKKIGFPLLRKVKPLK